jgi:hypothetical protein
LPSPPLCHAPLVWRRRRSRRRVMGMRKQTQKNSEQESAKRFLKQIIMQSHRRRFLEKNNVLEDNFRQE